MAVGMGIQPMSTTAGLENIKHKWGWFVALGIAQVALGTIAVGAACVMTVLSILLLGWLLLIGGVFSAVSAFWEKAWRGFFIDLVMGVLYFVAGLMMVRSPLESAVTLTLLIALLLIFSGAMRIGVALFHNFEHRWWVLLNGLVSLVLGIIIYKDWPESSLWLIGLFVGIEMIFYGWSLVMLGFAAKNLPKSPTAAAA
jgi:uncharacterized membrane protein HdeD (DUF308 family)